MSNIVPRSGPGRPTLLDKQPGLIELVAELYASGLKQKDILEEIPASDPQTLRNWLKDERVVQKVEEIIRERTLRIRRKIDGELEKRIADPNRIRQMPPESLLKIRDSMTKDLPPRSASDAEQTRIIEQLYLMASTDPAAAALIAKLNLDPEGTVTVTAEEIVDDAEEAPAAIDVETVLEAALQKQEDDIEPEEGLPL
mgnify:CR=1 FL=1